MIIDLLKEAKGQEDSRILDAILHTLIGQPCAKFELTYADELMVHFGQLVPYSHSKLTTEPRGEFILGTLGSAWTLNLHEPPFAIQSNDLDPESLPEIEDKFQQMRGAVLVQRELEVCLRVVSS